MRKKVAAVALGIGFVSLGASIANAQLGGFLKALKDAANQTSNQSGSNPQAQSSAATLAGRWLPVGESCTADQGRSENVLEIAGREERTSFSTCTYPQIFSNRTAYVGVGKCTGEEGEESSYTQSFQISADGNMVSAVKVDGKVVRTTWKTCSNPLYFTNEDIPAPVKTAAVRGAQAVSKNRGETLISCQVGSKNLNVIRSNNKYIYTYGAPGLSPEMSIESTGKDGKLFKYFGVYFGGNQFQQLRFVNGQTNYIIYVSSGYGKNALLVSINKGVETERKCISNIDYWDRQLNLLDISEDSEYNATIR